MANLKYKDNNGEWKILNTVRGPKGDNADITVNGENKENASFYAPVESGEIGQFLMTKGENESPEWKTLSTVAATGNYSDLNGAFEKTNDILSQSEKVLTSGGAYTEFAKRGVPSGGGQGQTLIKSTDKDYEFEWGNAADPNAISGDGNIKKIISLTWNEYNNLEEIDANTEYHIIDISESASYIKKEEIQDMIDSSMSSLATVAASGNYNDLNSKPTIPTVNNTLTSTSTSEALSAAQGKTLNDSISTITHRIYTGSLDFNFNGAVNAERQITLDESASLFRSIRVYVYDNGYVDSIEMLPSWTANYRKPILLHGIQNYMHVKFIDMNTINIFLEHKSAISGVKNVTVVVEGQRV